MPSALYDSVLGSAPRLAFFRRPAPPPYHISLLPRFCPPTYARRDDTHATRCTEGKTREWGSAWTRPHSRLTAEMASPAQPATQTIGAVKIEPYDGHYDCFSCLESVRPDLKEAKAVGNDGNGAVLKCTACTAPPFHAQCVGVEHRTACATYRQTRVQPWSPWTHAAPVMGAIAVPDDGPDADQDQKEGGQGVAAAQQAPGPEAEPVRQCTHQRVPSQSVSRALTQLADFNANGNVDHAGLKPRQRLPPFRFLPLEEATMHSSSCMPPAASDTTAAITDRWLGTGNVGVKHHQFLPFKKALLYARSLKLKGVKEWQAWCKSGKRPANVPSHPDKAYTQDGWQGLGHWLGTGNVGVKHHQFLPFTKALLYARALKLNTTREWNQWCKTDERQANIPARPDLVYKHDGWQGYGHWLGTGNVAPKDLKFLPFKEALLYVRSLKLKCQKE